MSRINFPKFYNPANQSRRELIDNFVVRTALFRDIFEDVKHSEMTHPEQHYIIQGIRGQGKTTLLLRIAYEIENDAELQRRIIPVVFNEEHYHITRLFKLWESTADYLEESKGITGLYTEMQAFADDEDYEYRCFQILENELKKRKKKLILFIDNIDEIFNKLSKQETSRLREIFMESAEIRVIGASSVSLEFHYDYGKQFYQFFRMPKMKGLGTAETKTLLLSLGEHYKRNRVIDIVRNQPGRIEALRRMTGGVIRTMVILFEIFVDDANGNAFMDLEKILDIVTPLYQHRMDKLSPQQQEIVDAVALNWDAVSTHEIAKKTKLQSKAVSAQLRQLGKYHIVEKVTTNTKNHLYRIYERFFNIWYLMRLGRKWDVRRIRFFVEFLQIWCDERELENKARTHLAAVKQAKVHEKHAMYMTEALAHTPLQRDLQHQLITETRSYLDQVNSEFKECLSRSDIELKNAAIGALKSQHVDEALHQIEKIKRKDSDELAELGILYNTEFKDLKKAEKFFLMAVEKEHPGAMNNLAVLYKNEFKDLKKAEKFYLMAVEKEHAGAMVNLAVLYQIEFKDFKKAEKFYLMAVEKEHAEAMFILAVLYQSEFKDLKKAEKFYLMAVEKEHPEAMFILAVLYQSEFKDLKKAEKFYLMAVERDHFNAMNALAWLYFEEKTHKQKANEYAGQTCRKKRTIYNSHTYAMTLLWNNEIEMAYKIAREFLDNQKSFEKFPEEISRFLMLLIAKQQHHLALKIFNENPHELKDRFRPLYYALMFFMQTEYPLEYRKVGGELKQTVQKY